MISKSMKRHCVFGMASALAWLCVVNGVQVVFADREATTAIMPMTDIMQFLAFSNKADMVTGPSATGLAGTWDVPYCIGERKIITPQGDGSYWENGKTYVLRFAAAQMGLLVAAHKVCCFIMEQKMGMCCLSLCRLAVDTKLLCHCLEQVLGNPEMEQGANQHEDYLARYMEMDGRGIAMSTAFPSFAKEGFVAGPVQGH